MQKAASAAFFHSRSRPVLYCLVAALLFGGGYLLGHTRGLHAGKSIIQTAEAPPARQESASLTFSDSEKTPREQDAPPAATGESAGETAPRLAASPQTAGPSPEASDAPGDVPGDALGDIPDATRHSAAAQPGLDEFGNNPAQRAAPSGATQPETVNALAGPYPFSRSSGSFMLSKLGNGQGPTLLVVGGIQGDEPGGFSAAALLASHYRIMSGSVWVVPDLNFPSILQRHRGLFGDMNRKFAAISPDDPEFDTVARIKSVLLSEQVGLILNLHDGSGFYRPVWEDALRNPKRWGQSVIIDQDRMEAPRFNRLFETAGHVETEVNRSLLDPEHRYHTYNTFTAQGNVEMAKTLSWFAVRNGKPAFGIEASKEFGTEYRAYYHLTVVEAFMRRMGIEYERDFDLSPAGVMAALNSGLGLSAFNGRLVLPLDDVRPVLTHVPFKKTAEPEERVSKPLLALVRDKAKGDWRVAYGNRTLTRLTPDYRDFDESLSHADVLVDGVERRVALGGIVPVAESFLVKGVDGYRVNAIGAQKEVNGTEADVTLTRADFMPRFSVDKAASVYRVELYRGKAFAGMLLVRFKDGATLPAPESLPPQEKPLTAGDGRESALGM